MAHLDHTGPENTGPKTGRKLGKCKKDENSEFEIGVGMCMKSKADDSNEG